MRLLLSGIVSVLICGAAPAVGADPTPTGVSRQAADQVLAEAMGYLRRQQQPDGSFGTAQSHLQTGLVILTILSQTGSPSPEDRQIVEKAVHWLLENSSRSGDLGDSEFSVESHSVCLTALLHALPVLKDDELAAEARKMAYRGLRLLIRWQDRSSSGGSRGGWKMEGSKGKENDRRASAWALYALQTARNFGLAIPEANLDRGASYLLAALKRDPGNPAQLGGLSVDTEGLAVASITAMGSWVLAQLAPEEQAQQLTADWLARHPPVWSGPNYFYTNFFRMRGLYLLPVDEALFADAYRQTFFQLKDHQGLDGSLDFPPGNAQNTVSMGRIFSTAMAVLIIQGGQSRLVADEQWQVLPSF